MMAVPITCDCKKKLAGYLGQHRRTVTLHVPSGRDRDEDMEQYVRELYQFSEELTKITGKQLSYERLSWACGMTAAAQYDGILLIDGKEVVIRSPKDAFDYKIGMIHQHFKLVDVFSAAENIVLGLEDEKKYDIKKSAQKVKEISEKYGFEIDTEKKIYDMSVSEKQTVEIVKVLYRGADILILDEPTAVLTPQETVKLFKVLRKMREHGKSIIIITHKLHEVLALSDKVAVLRKGEYIGTVETKNTNEKELTEMMVGKKISLDIERAEPKTLLTDWKLKISTAPITRV